MRAYGGLVRSAKGKLVEKITANLLRAAWIYGDDGAVIGAGCWPLIIRWQPRPQLFFYAGCVQAGGGQ